MKIPDRRSSDFDADSDLTSAFTAISLGDNPRSNDIKLQRKPFKRKTLSRSCIKVSYTESSDTSSSDSPFKILSLKSKKSSSFRDFSQQLYFSDSELEIGRSQRLRVTKMSKSRFYLDTKRSSFRVGQYSKISNESSTSTHKNDRFALQSDFEDALTSVSKDAQKTSIHESCSQASFPCRTPKSCLTQARHAEDVSVNELAAYFDEIVHLPKKISRAAESMYA